MTSIAARMFRPFTSLIESARQSRTDQYYAKQPYLEAYRAHTDDRVDKDAQKAIGGRWEELGQLQYDFLRAHGLRPEHRMLDIGCGTLRGGRLFIGYLETGNYTGFELSPKALTVARATVEEEGLAGKEPRLVLNASMDLTFAELAPERYDVLLAQSVFSHLRPADIELCFENLGRVMASGSMFFFTYWDRPAFEQIQAKSFGYPLSFFERLAGLHGFTISDLSAEYGHPSGQSMVKLEAPKALSPAS